MKSRTSVRPRALPSPVELGLPPKYVEWRDAQVRAIEFVRGSKKRIRGVAAPTGTGKGSMALGLAKLLLLDNPHARILILTETKGLQAIYDGEGQQMEPAGLVANISGAVNYVCPALEPDGRYGYLASSRSLKPTCDNGPCNAGMQCKLRDRGCTYYGSDGALAQARSASIVITNYANWFAAADQSEKEEKFGDFDLIIFDESHSTADVLCNSLAAEIDLRDVRHLKPAPSGSNLSMERWVSWAGLLLSQLEGQLADLQADLKSIKASSGRVPPALLVDLKRTQRLTRAATRVTTARGEWIPIRVGSKLTFKPVWPDQYCESHLLRGVPQAVFMSATLVPQDLRNIGLKDFDFISIPSTFPAANRPVYIFPCALMRWDMTDAEKEKMAVGLGTVVKCRPSWRGLVHTVSYKLSEYIESQSVAPSRMVYHTSSNRQRIVDWFKNGSPEDAVLSSPAMHTGEDLPYDRCRFQVLAKIPFPDRRDPIVAARSQRDKKYVYYAAAKYIRQAYGRATRAHDDFSEFWVLDASWSAWFYKAAEEFFDDAFKDAVKRVNGIGRAPKI